VHWDWVKRRWKVQHVRWEVVIPVEGIAGRTWDGPVASEEVVLQVNARHHPVLVLGQAQTSAAAVVVAAVKLVEKRAAAGTVAATSERVDLGVYHLAVDLDLDSDLDQVVVVDTP
jgi:hypothetical protein